MYNKYNTFLKEIKYVRSICTDTSSQNYDKSIFIHFVTGNYDCIIGISMLQSVDAFDDTDFWSAFLLYYVSFEQRV